MQEIQKSEDAVDAALARMAGGWFRRTLHIHDERPLTRLCDEVHACLLKALAELSSPDMV
jgi:hypothetical protein